MTGKLNVDIKPGRPLLLDLDRLPKRPRNPLYEAVEEISCHINHRYELKLREGKAELSFNEMAGIIARHLLVQPK